MNQLMYRTYYNTRSQNARTPGKLFNKGRLTQIWRVPSPLNSTGTGVAPRSEAIEK